jgi:two-component system KDP operon response regulator KdpE
VATGSTSKHILVVEPDPIQGESVRAVLEYCGFTCVIVATGVAALHRFKRDRADAIVADPDLPDCDGLELISTLRSASRVPLIIVSRQCTEDAKVAALDLGADDYVAKPFHPGEFVARIRAKLRLSHLDQSDHPVDPDRQADLDLSKMERVLLSQLIKHQGAVVPDDQLIAALWGSHGDGTQTDLRVLVLRLRRKLELQHQPLFVLKKRGVGYYVSGWGRLSRNVTQDKNTADAGWASEGEFRDHDHDDASLNRIRRRRA